jgi:hypothetical protein
MHKARFYAEPRFGGFDERVFSRLRGGKTTSAGQELKDDVSSQYSQLAEKMTSYKKRIILLAEVG